MSGGRARLRPRWFVVTAWHVRRWMFRVTRGREGLWPPRPRKWGALRLTTTGRRSGEPRRVIDEKLDDYAARRGHETAVVVLEPLSVVDGSGQHPGGRV